MDRSGIVQVRKHVQIYPNPQHSSDEGEVGRSLHLHCCNSTHMHNRKLFYSYPPQSESLRDKIFKCVCAPPHSDDATAYASLLWGISWENTEDTHSKSYQELTLTK